MALPSTFDGDRANGKVFMIQCRAYLDLYHEQFEDDVARIQWVMSFMKEGRAARFVEEAYDLRAAGADPYPTWNDFQSDFIARFFPLHPTERATNVLEGITYFQNRRSVDEYLDEFRGLITQSGYVDPKIIVVKFWRGLNQSIGAQIANMLHGRPMDNDPEGWYAAAMLIDQTRAATSAFQSTLPTAPPARGAYTRGQALPAAAGQQQPRRQYTPGVIPTLPAPPTRQPFSTRPPFQANRPPPPHTHQGPSPNAPTRPNPAPPRNRADVRALPRDDLEDLMQQLAARMDELDATTPVIERGDTEEETADDTEDFRENEG